MSRRVVIQGGNACLLAHLAEEIVAEMRAESSGNLRFDAVAKIFVYDGLDDYYKSGIIQKAESRYGVKLQKLQDFRVRQVEENAQKHGYLVKTKQTEKGGKVKIVLARRVYGG